MKSKTLKTLICAGALVAAMPSTWAADGEASIVSMQERWLNERDVLVEKISDRWLENKSDPELRKMLMRLITLEVRLSTREGMELYTSQLGHTNDPDKAVAKVALAYLKTTGWSSDTAALIEGKTFEVERPVQPPEMTTEKKLQGPSWRNGEEPSE